MRVEQTAVWPLSRGLKLAYWVCTIWEKTIKTVIHAVPKKEWKGRGNIFKSLVPKRSHHNGKEFWNALKIALEL